MNVAQSLAAEQLQEPSSELATRGVDYAITKIFKRSQF